MFFISGLEQNEGYFIYETEEVSLIKNLEKTLDLQKGFLSRKITVPHLKTNKSKSLSKWFDIPEERVDYNLKQEKEAVEMRNVLKEEIDQTGKKISKFFHVGSIIETPFDYYEKLTKKERNRTLLDSITSSLKEKRIINKKKEAFRTEMIIEKQKERRKRKKTIFNKNK